MPVQPLPCLTVFIVQVHTLAATTSTTLQSLLLPTRPSLPPFITTPIPNSFYNKSRLMVQPPVSPPASNVQNITTHLLQTASLVCPVIPILAPGGVRGRAILPTNWMANDFLQTVRNSISCTRRLKYPFRFLI